MDSSYALGLVLAGLFIFYLVAERRRLTARGQRRFGSRAQDFIPSPEERLRFFPRRTRKRPVSLHPAEDPIPLYSHRRHFESDHCEVCDRQPRMRFEDEQARMFEFCIVHGQEKASSFYANGFRLTIDTR